MASSSTPLQIMDDDDEGFDWEAAVREIDVACNRQTSTTTTSEKPTSNSYSLNCNAGVASNPFQNSHKNGNFNASVTRQSTLDRFIGGVSTNSLKKPEKEAKLYNNSNNDRSGVVSECEGVGVLNEFVKIDPEAAKTWIYPVNVPRREYQFSITKTALFSNTLVVLPTGLGKTLIAAVVMYNYFRWFPEGKIVFAAPSRPLVMQQIEACHKIVGIPQEWTIDLTGQTSPTRRAGLWRDKRVFFVTPQVLEKDIHSGSCLVKYLVCLVIDEAHRATGNYSYCVAIRELMDAPVQLRILALTATPGSKQQTIQDIINNLKVSTLEHRNESDPDVLPYVHERKLELIQVPMGDEAVQVNNLILEVVRPLVSRLSAFGLFPRRDFQTLSPCDLLTSRDRFRQEPPRDLPESKKGEIEGYFTVLITLYHVKKLLSSHGIKPALEMLEEKLTQGYFARLVSRNEFLLKAKLLMQQTVSHGAPSPKLEKLLEVLTAHFKVKDPQNSRVIIFSNFRGSVRDILNALTNIGQFVKATEFIGQSSGKTLKGQSQKVQQAVLQKFRTGGYNVIVATSIGEEGLDIMEVDLVICFDANISPLRMIQRMGRTGRKHEGRVVVLACEGSELKGYSRKQMNSKAIKKHMHNGGLNSFNFHSSPRMIPHIYKPEVQFVELSIEEFVPRGKNIKDDSPISVPVYKTKLTDAEKALLAKYGETSWKPSLIVFPQIQAYPSSVNKVAHSSRTVMLIDTMQYLQGLKFSNDVKTLLTEDEEILDPCLRVDMVEEPCDRVVKDSEKNFDYPGEEKLQTVVECDIELEEVSGTKDVRIEDLHKQKPSLHSFMFGTEFVSVDDLGNVLVLSLPQLPFKSHSKSINGNSMAYECNLMHNSYDNGPEGENVLKSSARNTSASVLPEPEEIPQTPVSNTKSNENGIFSEDHNMECDTTVMEVADDPNDELRDSEFSPRLTNFIKSGIVPESPIHNSAQTPAPDAPLAENSQKVCTPPVTKETQTPFAKLSNTSDGKDWLLDSGFNPETVGQQRKFKRLRKHGDINRKALPELNEPTDQNGKMRNGCNLSEKKFVKGKKRQATDAAMCIEEEAEISSDGMAFDDEEEEDELENSSYEDSFIDDGTNPTSSTTQAGASKPDMMAIYRRSLLSQSPFPRLPNYSTSYSPNSVVQSSRLDRSGSSSGTKDVHTPQIGLESTARNSQLACDKTSSEPDSRKRKLSYYQEKALPMVNLDKEFSSISEASAENSSMQIQAEKMEEDGFLDEDDLFYAGIDLDAIEEEATKLLGLKSQRVTQKADTTTKPRPPPPFEPNFGFLGSPSFDLGF